MEPRLIFTALAGSVLALLVAAPAAVKFQRQMPAPMGVVDLMTVTQEQAELIQKGTGSTEEKNQRASAFALRLEAEVAALAQECHCTLLVKAAVLGGALPDHTGRLKQRLAK